MFEALDRYTDSCIMLSDAERSRFHSLLTIKNVPKKTVLLQAGDVCDFEAFVVKGCARVYFLNESGKDTELYFPVENWWISDLPSFTFRKPATLNIETIEPCELIVISRDAKEKLFSEIPKFERMFRLMLQRSNEELMNRFISNVSMSAEERYQIFLKKYPELPNRIPQQFIASYLGISAEFLSKIRSGKYKKAADWFLEPVQFLFSAEYTTLHS
jgi:CRP-like cAMP-binding protein